MSKSDTLIKTLSGLGFPIKKYPRRTAELEAREQISEPGFYLNEVGNTIEHWSHPAAWNLVLKDHSSNGKDLICDGFQSILPFEDITEMMAALKVWTNYINKEESK